MKTGRILTLQPTKRLFANPGTIAAAAVTGCKNIAKAVKAGEYEVDVPEWGVRLRTAAPVRESLCAVGIRAHYFNPEPLPGGAGGNHGRAVRTDRALPL